MARAAGAVLDPFVVVAGQLQNPPLGPEAAGPPCRVCTGEAAPVTALPGGSSRRKVAATVHAAGIDAGPHSDMPAVTQVDALGLASAYATLAAGGVHRPAHLVAEGRHTDGQVL